MGSILARRPYTDLGWSWWAVDGSTVAHLVPARPGPLSRTACGRLPVYRARLTAPQGLLEAAQRCQGCTERDS